MTRLRPVQPAGVLSGSAVAASSNESELLFIGQLVEKRRRAVLLCLSGQCLFFCCAWKESPGGGAPRLTDEVVQPTVGEAPGEDGVVTQWLS